MSQTFWPDADGGSASRSALELGAQLHAQGLRGDAIAAYRRCLAALELANGAPLDPQTAETARTARQLLGLAFLEDGDAAVALEQFDAAEALGAGSAELDFRRAGALRTLGRLNEALAAYERARLKAPDHAEALHHRGVCLAGLGRYEEADQAYGEALAVNPDAKAVWNNRGVALEARGLFKEALEAFDQALALDGAYLQAHHNRGSALLKLGRLEDAIVSFDRALALSHAVPEPWSHRAVALAGLKRYGEALESAQRALALRPGYPEALNTSSVALRGLGRDAEALNAADAALRSRPAFAEAHSSRGSALLTLGDAQGACTAFKAALDLRPDDAAILLNYGMALEATGDLAAAAAILERSEALAPDLPDARFARALVSIRSGDIKTGFALYEARWRQSGGPKLAYPEDRLWLGHEPLGDETLLIHAEQGFGDVIQFSRFVSKVAAPSRMIIQVQPALRRLMYGLGGARVLSTAEDPPPFDRHIPFMSLPLALKLDLDDVRPSGPYLSATPVLRDRWRARLREQRGQAAPRPIIGLVWAGNPLHENDRNRSIRLETLAPIFALDAEFVSLQKAIPPRDAALAAATGRLQRFDDAFPDFAETAALISLCDLVIAVDTAVAHLAGALGKPLWLLLPRPCDWRWMNDRADTPWYPSAVLFRQARAGVWEDVIDDVLSRLESVLYPGAGAQDRSS